MGAELALLGGDKSVRQPVKPYASIGQKEKAAVLDVLESGCLSGFYGNWSPLFLGGPVVRRFEEAWASRFAVPHAVSVNSATSGLFAAVGAAGVGPGDEVIVPPYTMSATAMAPLVYGGIPVFADIEADTFCIDPDSVAQLLNDRTRAVIAVNLFGHPARLAELKAMTDKAGVVLIEDNAQAPLAAEQGQLAGTVGDIGVFSLNYHKHIHSGEGGVCVTRSDDLARRLRAIRNHGENVVDEMDLADITNMIGFNYRMTEMSAAVGIVQLEDVYDHVAKRQDLAEAFSREIGALEGITVPSVRSECRHVYYVWAAKIDKRRLGVTRGAFCKALKAEGVPLSEGYVRPLYHLPVFQRRHALGRDGFPFTLTKRRYDGELCPVVEKMHREELFLIETCSYDYNDALVGEIIDAFRKVHAARDKLRSLEAAG